MLREIQEAVRLERNIVPVIEEGTDFSREMSYLPDELRAVVSRKNALTLSQFSFDEAMEMLRSHFLTTPEAVKITEAPAEERAEVQRRMAAVAEEARQSAQTGSPAVLEQSRRPLQQPRNLILIAVVMVAVVAVVISLLASENRSGDTGSAAGLTSDPLPQAAFTPVARNADWTPVESDFDGVTMVLVPAGCFDMGEDGEGGRQCFEEPFWIDKYEVTQADFARLDGTQASEPGFSGDTRPVERISWFEARDFCAARGGRLPTEAEWEYAARGPDGLMYPWGNEFVADNLVYSDTSDQTVAVGSHPNGAAWVGAMDVSGNVWEWMLSEFRDYPYDPDDGRENINSDSRRVVRGGSWANYFELAQTTYRLSYNPDLADHTFGFRCVHPPSP